MAKPKRKNKTTRQKLDRVRRIVVTCMRIANKKLKVNLVDLIVEHVVAKLPSHLMRRLARGDCGKPMLAAMKLTAPYFA